MHLFFFCFLDPVLLVLELIYFLVMGNEIYLVRFLELYFEYHYFKTYLIIYFCFILLFFVFHLQFILLIFHLFVIKYLFLLVGILIIHLQLEMFRLEEKIGFVVFVNLILISFDLSLFLIQLICVFNL